MAEPHSQQQDESSPPTSSSADSSAAAAGGEPHAEAAAPAGRIPRRDVLAAVAAACAGSIVGLLPVGVGSIVFLDPVIRGRGAGGDEEEGGPGEWLRIGTYESVPADATPARFPVINDLEDAWSLTPSQPVGAVYLRRDPDETLELNVLSAICPHAGCFVAYSAAAGAFLCPCHDSAFALDGTKLDKPGRSNPSPRNMDSLNYEFRRGEQRLDPQDDKEKITELASAGEPLEVWVKYVNYLTAREEQIPK